MQPLLPMLYETALADIQQTPETLAAFLSFSAVLFKHSFPNQVLVFAQNPQATLVAEAGVWKKLGRSCNGSALRGLTLDQKDRLVELPLYELSETVGDDAAFRQLITQQVWQVTEADRIPLEHLWNGQTDVPFPMSLQDHLLGKTSTAAIISAKKNRTEPF